MAVTGDAAPLTCFFGSHNTPLVVDVWSEYSGCQGPGEGEKWQGHIMHETLEAYSGIDIVHMLSPS